MEELKVGDKVVLTGRMWSSYRTYVDNTSGNTYEVVVVDEYGPGIYLTDKDREWQDAWYIINDGNWDAEKVEEN